MMIAHLDNLLRHLLMAQIDEITAETQVRFQPPDEEWRTYVANLTVEGQPVNALNVYLVDLIENRELRSNERIRQVRNGLVRQTPAPRRIDCHYLITAWSPASATPAVEPSVDEHALLYKVTGGLMNNDPLVPRVIYAPDPLPITFPEVLADTELPVKILPAEGINKFTEFWSTVNTHWKPGVHLIVTLPVILDVRIEGPLVTTRITEYRHRHTSDISNMWLQISGTVMDNLHLNPDGSPRPAAGAWVRLESPSGESLQTTESDAVGRFTFARLRAGSYRLRARATGLGEILRDIEVPSPSGEYDVTFTKST